MNGSGSVLIYIVRHGRTGGNKQRYVGWEDEPLDEVGRAQAVEVAQALDGEPLDAVYASPLSRARDTAAPLAAARGLAVQVREALKEIDYGRYQGMLKADQPLKLRHDHRYEAMPGGESLHDVYLRLARFWEGLRRERHAGCAVVAHFWSNRMLLGVMLGVPFEELFEQVRYKPENGSVYRVACRRDASGLLRAEGGAFLLPAIG
jgi:probable phosphoglycerate mutase